MIHLTKMIAIYLQLLLIISLTSFSKNKEIKKKIN